MSRFGNLRGGPDGRMTANDEACWNELIAQAAADTPDPLKFLDEVRTKALAPMDGTELTDAREAIERVLAKIEGSLTGPKL